MSQNNRACYTCGKLYSYCFSCPDDPRPRWTFMFCCENCKDIFEILTSYGAGHITAQETINLLKKYDLQNKDLSSYSYGIQKLMNQINNELSSTIEEDMLSLPITQNTKKKKQKTTK